MPDYNRELDHGFYRQQEIRSWYDGMPSHTYPVHRHAPDFVSQNPWKKDELRDWKPFEFREHWFDHPPRPGGDYRNFTVPNPSPEPASEVVEAIPGERQASLSEYSSIEPMGLDSLGGFSSSESYEGLDSQEQIGGAWEQADADASLESFAEIDQEEFSPGGFGDIYGDPGLEEMVAMAGPDVAPGMDAMNPYDPYMGGPDQGFDDHV